MAISIARKTLLHEWRRFLPAVVAVAFSGVLIISQGALLIGIVGANALYVTQSTADIWVGFRGTQSVELGRPILADTITNFFVDPAVARMEPFLLGSGDWRSAKEKGGTSVTVVGIDTAFDGLGLTHIVSANLRGALREPGAVVIDAADSSKLSTSSGDTAEINGRKVKVIGLINGLRGLGGVNVVGSLDTARLIDRTLPSDTGATYFIGRLTDPDSEVSTVSELQRTSLSPRTEIWRSQTLADLSTNYMLMESGAGIAFIFATLIALVIGTLITSQTLLAAVNGNIAQYATLRALGVPFQGLQSIVLEQAAWVGLCGLAVSTFVSVTIAAIANAYRVPFEFRISILLGASAVLFIVAMVAGLLAIRRLRGVDPATLLR
ncbi:FtsX-like permease family protein [Rhizobium vallis]|uniref:FtsX-like permease family protein n=1 Tax=Rhizobium vallis TaxID=634290 RepID=A0A432PNA3_9HYPH|nr:FtsX-like permease family protein [Rhizobium vallis]RUM25848.1 FtsX-like permease family protein [Rhizobium vallis]